MKIKSIFKDGQAVWHLLMLVLVLISVCPILFAVTGSVKTLEDLYNGGFFPKEIIFDNFKRIAAAVPIVRITLNTFIIAVCVTAFKVVTSTLAAYSFVYFDFKGKQIIYFILISTIFIPFTVTMIPNYLTISKLGLVDKIWGVMLPQLADASGIFLIRQAMRAVPKPLTEIAHLDGISELRILKDIIIPVTRPAIISTGIIFFINSWNEYVWPTLILRSNENFTLSLAMQVFTDSEGGVEYTMTMAMAVITMILPIALYLIFQRYIMSTFASSGIKG